MLLLDAINRRVGRDSDFYAGAGIHRDRKAFAAPVMLILPELRHIRSGSLANRRARPGLAERTRFVGNRLEPSLTLRENGGTGEPPPFSTARGTSSALIPPTKSSIAVLSSRLFFRTNLSSFSAVALCLESRRFTSLRDGSNREACEAVIL